MERQTEKSPLEGSQEREGHLSREDGRHPEDNNIDIIGGEMLTRYEHLTITEVGR